VVVGRGHSVMGVGNLGIANTSHAWKITSKGRYGFSYHMRYGSNRHINDRSCQPLADVKYKAYPDREVPHRGVNLDGARPNQLGGCTHVRVYEHMAAP
jgi:hypothetical protein